MSFSFIWSNIPAAPAYGLYISQSIRYFRACGSYQDLLDWGVLLTRTLLNQWFLLLTLKSSLRTFYGFHHYLAGRYRIYVHKWPRIFSTCHKHFLILSSFMTYHRVYNYVNTTGTTSGAGTAFPSGAPGFTPVLWCSCYSIFSFVCMFYRSLFVLLYFFFWPLCCLFFDLRIVITPLVSPNPSWSHHLVDRCGLSVS